jgi:site-specific DNA recombinase
MENKTRSAEEIIKEIESGKFRDFYLVYNRKSTDDQVIQKNSIKYQKSENMRFAFRSHLSVAPITIEGFMRDGIISERHSGFKESNELTFNGDGKVQYTVDRPKFYRLAEWLNKGYFKGVIFLCWDRASRNKGDENILRKLMKAGVDMQFVLAQYDKTSSGALHMDIDGMFAEHHSRVTSEKVSLTLTNKRAQGICTHKAPVGYLNQGSMENKPLDPVRAPIVKKLFELYATGDWSLADLARWATEQGFTMSPMRRRRTQDEILAEEEDDIRLEIEAVSRPPTYNNINKILKNFAYTGRTLDDHGQWIKSMSYEAIVSDKLFNDVQAQLHKKNKSAHYIRVLNHPLRNLIYCRVCGRVYTPYPKKGIMYYGARCCKSCANTNKSFNFDFITEKVGSLIQRLSFTKEELEELDAHTGTEIAILESKRLDKLEDADRRKKKIREDLAYLNANRLTLLKTGAYTPEGIAAEETRLNFELSSLQTAGQASDVAIRETVKDVVKLSELLKNVAIYYQIAKPDEKDAIIKEIFSELTLDGKALDYQCKKGFEPLSSRFAPMSSPRGNRTPIYAVKGRRPNH